MSYNRTLAVLLVVTVAAVCGVAGVAVFTWPDDVVRPLDTRWLRGSVLLTCSLLAGLVAIEAYAIFHDPTPVRMVKYVITYTMGIGATAAVSPIGYLGLQKFEGFGVTATAQEVGITSGVIVIAMFMALCYLVTLYTKIHPDRIPAGGP